MKFGGIGVPELLIILAVALLIFGPKNLPKLGSALGKTVKNLREGMGGKKDEEAEAEEAVVEDEAEVVEDEAEAEAEEAPRKAAPKKKPASSTGAAKKPASAPAKKRPASSTAAKKTPTKKKAE